jgi:hypothetical protein
LLDIAHEYTKVLTAKMFSKRLSNLRRKEILSSNETNEGKSRVEDVACVHISEIQMVSPQLLSMHRSELHISQWQRRLKMNGGVDARAEQTEQSSSA